MKFLIVDVANNVEILETTDCCNAIEIAVAEVNNGVSAELFFELAGTWYGWVNELDFMGTRPKHPPTR